MQGEQGLRRFLLQPRAVEREVADLLALSVEQKGPRGRWGHVGPGRGPDAGRRDAGETWSINGGGTGREMAWGSSAPRLRTQAGGAAPGAHAVLDGRGVTCGVLSSYMAGCCRAPSACLGSPGRSGPRTSSTRCPRGTAAGRIPPRRRTGARTGRGGGCPRSAPASSAASARTWCGASPWAPARGGRPSPL